MVAHCGIAVRQCIGRIEFYGTFEQHERPFHLLRHSGINVELGPKHKVISIQVVGTPALHPVDFGTPQARCDCADSRYGDLVLEREDIVGAAVIPLGPDMGAGRCIDHLARHAHVAAGPAHAAFEHIPDAKLATDLLHVHGAAPVGKS